MRIVPASASPFLPYSPGGAPVFPAGPQPDLYLHHQYGFATDASEWVSRVGTRSAVQPNAAKRPVQTPDGILSDGTKGMQVLAMPFSTYPAVTTIVAFSLPFGSGGIIIETGADYHAGSAFNLFAENGSRLYSAYVSGAEVAQQVTRTTEADTAIIRLKPPTELIDDALRIEGKTAGAGSKYYATGVASYSVADNPLNLFARNNAASSGPAGLLIKQVLVFPATLTSAQVDAWIATF